VVLSNIEINEIAKMPTVGKSAKLTWENISITSIQDVGIFDRFNRVPKVKSEKQIIANGIKFNFKYILIHI